MLAAIMIPAIPKAFLENILLQLLFACIYLDDWGFKTEFARSRRLDVGQ
jgi:hypothetical protein